MVLALHHLWEELGARRTTVSWLCRLCFMPQVLSGIPILRAAMVHLGEMLVATLATSSNMWVNSCLNILRYRGIIGINDVIGNWISPAEGATEPQYTQERVLFFLDP